MSIGYTCIFEDGTEGRATWVDEPPTFQFGTDPPIPLDAHLLYAHGRIVNGEYLVVGMGAKAPIEDTGILIRRWDPVVTVLSLCRGPNAIQVEPDGIPSWVPVELVNGKPVYFNEVRYADGRPPTPANDFAHPRGPSLRRETWNGELVVVIDEHDGWTLAESGLAPDGHTRILIRKGTDAPQIVWNTPTSYTSTPAQFALTPMGPIVAINYPNDRASYFRHPHTFKPWAPYVSPPPPTIRVPDFPVCPHVMSIGFAYEPSPVDWCEWCVFDKDTPAQQQAKIDKARARKVPIVADWDAGDVFDWGRFDEFKDKCQGVLAIPALRFYPLMGEAPSHAVARWRPEAERAARDYPGQWSYVFCAYRQIDGHGVFHIGAQDVIDLWNLGYRLGNEFRARHAEGFAWRRPGNPAEPAVDGVMASPDMQEAARRMYTAVPTTRQYPTQPPPAPAVVVPPVTVPPVKPTPTPKPKSRFWHNVSEAIKRWFR